MNIYRGLNMCVVALMLVCGLQAAKALPLLSETGGTIKTGIVTLYKDHHNPNKYYFFPNSTRFAQDKQKIPQFNFVHWGLTGKSDPASAGAYLTMTTRLAMDEDQASAIQKFMNENPKVEVSVLPVKSSTIGLQTTNPSGQPLGRIFEEFNFSKLAGRAEDEIGINAVLNAVGAKAFRGMLLNSAGGSNIKFDYCYVIQGLGPNMEAEIRVDMKRAYELFSANHSGGWKWFGWQISAVVEKLHAQKAISISMDGGNATEWEYLQKISETIAARLFEPELPASAKVGEASSNRLFRFTGGYVKKEEHKTETWNWKRQDLEDREFCTAVVLKDLDPYKKSLITDADSVE